MPAATRETCLIVLSRSAGSSMMMPTATKGTTVMSVRIPMIVP